MSALLHSLGLAQPLALAALALVAVMVLVARARLRNTARGLKYAVVIVRAGIVALMALALSQPTLRPPGHGRAVVFAIDVSDSVTSDQIAWARSWVERATRSLPPGSQASVLEFGSRAQLSGSSETLSTGSTDLAAALKLAGSVLSRDGGTDPEVVLLTDGWQTSGPAAIDALPRGASVSYVVLPPPTDSTRPTAVIHTMSATSVMRAGETIDVQLDLQSTQSVDANLRLALDQAIVADGPVHLEPGLTHLTLPVPIPSAGFFQVDAELRSEDGTSTMHTAVVAKPAGHILLLEDEPGSADALAALLSRQGLEIERRASSSVPPSANDLSTFDGIVLVNTPATALSLDQQRTLQSFVQDLGRGLIVTGGGHAYSTGGYQGTVLDDMLPVSAEPPVEPQQGSLALFLVIDRSGSMDIISGAGPGSTGATKMAMAREAAMQAAALLQPEDTLGVIAFDSAFGWVVPPTKLHGPDDVKTATARIATIKAGGGTSILPPLDAAVQAAMKTDAPLRHIILMTDGDSNDHGYEQLLSQMTANQITLSTLAIGSDADTRLLTMLAHLGGGRYYFTERSTEIPRIATKETTILTRNALVEGHVSAIVTDPSPILRSISGDLPALSGYVATTRKDRAVTALETERGHPLLAHWQYGLGRVVAWTSEAQQGWGSDWAAWPDAGQFWSQAVRWALPAPVQPTFQPVAQLGPDGRQLHLSVQALTDDGHFAELQDTSATVRSPDGSARQISLPQTAPGTYSMDTTVSSPGEYRVLFQQGARQEVAAFSAPDSVELHSVGTNTALLEQLANASGGHPLTDPVDLRPGNGAGPAMELWPWLLGAALVLMPLDVLLRRRV